MCRGVDGFVGSGGLWVGLVGREGGREVKG